MNEQFFVEGKHGTLVCVESETNGRTVVAASTERLSEAAFRRTLRENWPGVEFFVSRERHCWKAWAKT